MAILYASRGSFFTFGSRFAKLIHTDAPMEMHPHERHALLTRDAKRPPKRSIIVFTSIADYARCYSSDYLFLVATGGGRWRIRDFERATSRGIPYGAHYRDPSSVGPPSSSLGS